MEEKEKAAEEAKTKAREEAKARSRLARKSKAMARGRGQNLQGAGPGRNLIQPSIRTFGRGLYRGQQQAPAQAPVRELPDWDVDWEPPINNPPYRWSDDLNETAYAWGVHQNQTRRAEVLESVYGRMASLMINTGISMRKLINEMKDKM